MKTIMLLTAAHIGVKRFPLGLALAAALLLPPSARANQVTPGSPGEALSRDFTRAADSAAPTLAEFSTDNSGSPFRSTRLLSTPAVAWVLPDAGKLVEDFVSFQDGVYTFVAIDGPRPVGSVPDGSSTLLLLGSGLIGLFAAGRRFLPQTGSLSAGSA